MIQYLNNHNSLKKAFLASLFLHLVLVVYMFQSQTTVQVPAQQMVKISLIAAGLTEPPKPKTIPMPAAATKPIAKKKGMVISKPETSKEEVAPQELAMLEPESSAAKKTSEVSTDAVITTPIYNADYLHNPAPKYPESAKRRRQQGSVMLKVEVSSLGKAQQISIESSSGSDILDQSAMEAVWRWSFIPAKRNEELVTASVIVPIEFRLE